jgi:hypothetical protein
MKVLLVLIIIVLIILASCTENAPVRFSASGDNTTGYTFAVQIAPIHLSANISSTLNTASDKIVELLNK